MPTTMVGPALKGSRSCLQRALDLDRDGLSEQILVASSALLAFNPMRVVWESPLASDDYREHRDDFLRVLGLARHEAGLRAFWPSQGPQWDGLALLPTPSTTGVLLVEAKAHPGETRSSCGATAPESRQKIAAAFDQVQSHMGVPTGDWMSGHYQLANRLAYLYFLNEVAEVPAFLALVNFVDDASYRPTRLAEWRLHYQQLFADMGLRDGCRMLDRIITVFPQAPAAPEPLPSESLSLRALRDTSGPLRLADRIRLFVISHYIQPARVSQAASVRVNAGQVHRQMALENLIPAVCAALDTKLFEDLAAVTRIRRDGTNQSPAMTWEFRIRAGSP
jgi:hypothetical protein